MMRLSMGLCAALLVAGCGGAGQYGYARTYVALDQEEPFTEGATSPAYRDVRRDPRDYQSGTLTWFGVVTGTERQGDKWLVHLSHRVHQERHLCADMEAETCRVTVAERSEGGFSAVTGLHAEDKEGRNRLQPGSLVRVYGKVTGQYDAEGGPIIEARYYRHWPRGQYLTTASAGGMRR